MLGRLFAKMVGAKKKKLVRKKASRQKAPSRLKKSKSPRPRAKPKPQPKPRKKAPSRKGAPPVSFGKEIGRVVAFFRIPVVAVVKVTRGSLKLGDRIWIKGHTTDLKETLTSMQINHQPVTVLRKGEEGGVKVSSRSRRGDRVYLLTH